MIGETYLSVCIYMCLHQRRVAVVVYIPTFLPTPNDRLTNTEAIQLEKLGIKKEDAPFLR
jgi:hypothetical protein